eukprot:gene871-1364_t
MSDDLQEVIVIDDDSPTGRCKETTPIYDLQLVSDSLFQWQFKLKDFDDSTPAGRDLNSDLSILKQRYDQDHILMEARFPSDYPNKPFSLRVISPRMAASMYSGWVPFGCPRTSVELSPAAAVEGLFCQLPQALRREAVWYTGHVTAGGSVCIEALTLSRSKGAWQPDFSFEGIMNTVCMNMLDEERVKIETATGPGGMSGPLRIDLQHM